MCILQIDFYILFLTELINYMDFLKDLIFSHTLIFTYCLAIIMTPYWFRNRFSKNQLSNLSLTLGITGTFVGIFLGLLDFDTTNIESSVPSLLDGLKIAFVTSITGLVISIIVKIFPEFWKLPKIVSDDNVEKELLSSLIEMNNSTKSFKNSIIDLTKSISGDSETSLSTQLLKLRDSNNSGFESMNASFKEFADKVVADNTQSLIDALTDVMKDFNSKIN